MLANLQSLSLFADKRHYNAVVAQAAKKILSDPNDEPVLVVVLIDQLARDLGVRTTVIANTLCYLLWHNELSADMHQPLMYHGALYPLSSVQRPP